MQAIINGYGVEWLLHLIFPLIDQDHLSLNVFGIHNDLSSKEKTLEAIYIINDKKNMWQVSFTGDEAHLRKTNDLLNKLKNSNSKK